MPSSARYGTAASASANVNPAWSWSRYVARSSRMSGIPPQHPQGAGEHGDLGLRLVVLAIVGREAALGIEHARPARPPALAGQLDHLVLVMRVEDEEKAVVEDRLAALVGHRDA